MESNSRPYLQFNRLDSQTFSLAILPPYSSLSFSSVSFVRVMTKLSRSIVTVRRTFRYLNYGDHRAD